MAARTITTSRLLAGAALMAGQLVACTSSVREQPSGTGPDRFASCPANLASLFDPQQKKQLDGANGSFVDACDDAGNLVEYICTTEQVCSGGDCHDEPTAEVEPYPFDCGGSCTDGRCASQCPAEGASLKYAEVEVDGSMVIEVVTTGDQYECTPTSFCVDWFEEGALVDVTSGFSATELCIDAQPGTITIAEDCTFECVAL